MSNTLQDIKIQLNTLLIQEREFKNKRNTMPNEAWVYEDLLKDLGLERDKLLTQLKRAEYDKRPKPKGWITQTDIELAKQVPILDFVDNAPSHIKKRMLVHCIFHTDTNASCTLYTDQQTYHCYSCQANGDVISWVQHKYNYKFLEAVRYLLKK